MIGRLTPRRLAVVLLALALSATSLAVLAADAPAHPSDCHAQQACPADDHSYVWVDESDNGWDCALEGSPEVRPEDTTIIPYDAVNFACQSLGSVVGAPPVATAPTTTAPTTTTTPTVPVETVPAPERPKPKPLPVTKEPRPKATTPAPVQTTQQPKAVPKAEEPARAEARKPPPPKKPTVSAPREFLRPVGPPPNIRRDAPSLLPALTAGGYVFPVYGPSSFIDTYGAARATVSWHHGDDIFAPLGAPLLAVARGEVFSVGWNDIGGLRLWLRDEAGNEFYYAHLSAFSPLAVNGARVEAGAVLGFIGNTGDAEGTPYHVHFEIHPVSLLALGYDGVVNPTPYLLAWQRLQDFGIRFQAGSGSRAGLVRFNPGVGWVPAVDPSTLAPPEPGAILLQSSDISSASGLEPGSLRRALNQATPEEADGLAESLGQALSSEATAARQEALPTPLTRPVSEAEAGRRLASARNRLELRLRRQAVTHARAAALAATSRPFSSAPWDLLAICESGGNWSTNTGNGYSGGLQFAPGTWIAFGGARFALTAAEAARGEQIIIAERVLAAQGWIAWPACSAELGLR